VYVDTGFSLVELLVVLALIATVTAIASPSLEKMLTATRIRSAVNDWASSAQFARTEALRRNEMVTLCPSSNGSSCTSTDYEQGWIVIASSSTLSAGRILQDTFPKPRVTLVQATAKKIEFLPNGLLKNNFTGAHLTVRDFPAHDNSLTRHLCVGRTGRIKIYSDAEYMASTSDCGS
jgi:type IV fimbrial biogenesis protein FimT